jgi:hypothetical protein
MTEVEGVTGGVTVEMGLLTPADVWKQKDEWVAREAASLEAWNKMDEEMRATIMEIVGRTLDRLQERMDQWVPQSFEIEQAKYMDCRFRLLFTDLESEMKARAEITQRKIREAAAGTAALVEELEGHTSDAG